MFRHQVFKDHDLLYLFYSGNISHEENMQAIRNFSIDPNYHPTFNILSDIREQTHVSRSIVELDAQYDLVRTILSGNEIKIAYVVSNLNQITWKQIFHENGLGIKARVAFFLNLDDAFDWLKIPTDIRESIQSEKDRRAE